MSLSCAEYQWPDVQHLIKDRMKHAGKDPSLYDTNVIKYTNEYSIVVQEYCQHRVTIWLKTVGTEIFHTKHYWLHFEFAPSRGHIHAHMLLICDPYIMQLLEDHIKHHLTTKPKVLSEWVKKDI